MLLSRIVLQNSFLPNIDVGCKTNSLDLTRLCDERGPDALDKFKKLKPFEWKNYLALLGHRHMMLAPGLFYITR